MEETKKIWGKEVIIVNCNKYCGKLLVLNMGAESSIHYHKEKQETFCCLEGEAGLTIEDSNHVLTPLSQPKTIYPGQQHQFIGIISSVIIEISTHHDDSDVVRLTSSKVKDL